MGSLDSAYEEHITCFLVPKAGQRRWAEIVWVAGWFLMTTLPYTPSHVNYSGPAWELSCETWRWLISELASEHAWGSHYWCFRYSTGEAAQISVARIAQPVPHRLHLLCRAVPY